MPTFLPALELNRRFYTEVVRPLLIEIAPALHYSAALIGSGSEVLGFDTEMSTDHSWGPGIQLFLRDEDETAIAQIDAVLRARLPHEFQGYPVRFVPVPGETSLVPAPPGAPDARHRVYTSTLRQYLRDFMGLDLGSTLTPADWLTLPFQKLRAFTAGAVYEDTAGDLTALRTQLEWYPHDIWLYLLASGWTRVAQEEHLMPRAGFVGDEIGSTLIAARLVRDAMSLCFLMECQYAPYAKWFGSAFARLSCAPSLLPLLDRALRTPDWQERMMILSQIYRRVAELHNNLNITPFVDPTPRQFHDRPFVVMGGDRFAGALAAQIRNPQLSPVTTRPWIGNIDQFSDSTDLRENPLFRGPLRSLFA